MGNNIKQVQEFSVSTLLSNSGEYIIPVYQRNYAWDEAQIRQLIKDVIDSIDKDREKKYYIGTLIVYKTEINNKKLLETIDGQQRLTTLNIILIAIKNHPDLKHINTEWFKELNLSFSNRLKSEQTLIDLFNNSIIEDAKNYNNSILHAYDLVVSILKEELDINGKSNENRVSLETFTNYLFNYVTILRVEVPPLTDLNHYFEIMNNRGEQLEKHEVLKARLLDAFNAIEDKAEREKNSYVFHTIWEACANMEKYVQYGFSVEIRHKIFDINSWDNLTTNSFEEIKHCFTSIEDKNDDEKSIDDIIRDSRKEYKKENNTDENPERFYSIVNFSNFLLHVLRVFTKEDIPLDDKKLLNTFENHIKQLATNEAKIKFSKQFGFSLLKTKYLFDKFIIKRDTSKEQEEWSLLKIKNSKQTKGSLISYTASYPNSFEDTQLNRQLVQLLAMFHVSLPTLSYKHWLNAALNYVYENPNTTAEAYIINLEEIAKQFIFNRIVANTPQEYYNIIYKPCDRNKIYWSDTNSTIDESKFNFGDITNNLLFNYLDYQLWKKETLKSNRNSKIIDFKFTSRSSVEHYYPQNPKEGFPRIEDESVLNCFGNLCLISHSKNSVLNNFSPLSKAEFYLKGDIDSIKQYLMIQEAKDWGEKLIHKHHNEMMDLLKKIANE